MIKKEEVKIKYPSARIKALRSVLKKKNTTLEAEMLDCLYQLYKKHVNAGVREFIEEMEESEEPAIRKARASITQATD